MIRECKESNEEERSSEATEGVERRSARKKKKVKFLQVALKSQLTFKATRVYG